MDIGMDFLHRECRVLSEDPNPSFLDLHAAWHGSRIGMDGHLLIVRFESSWEPQSRLDLYFSEIPYFRYNPARFDCYHRYDVEHSWQSDASQADSTRILCIFIVLLCNLLWIRRLDLQS